MRGAPIQEQVTYFWGFGNHLEWREFADKSQDQDVQFDERPVPSPCRLHSTFSGQE